ncbi:MAG: hypothetical protein KAF41_00325 [Flavobacterium sp.]|jgi:hypothetical protein|uniref:hypothetical protein n=1 Tax=Flavobacterium lindanitolerans TaxID=428988 RepID=UPI00120D9B34|nr:hypothetical protein [Flavobacterium lindanitolerans]MBU7569073.1 hypothetical protein [Flavobacterium sp.]THD34166.1 MAG: hypothetical protein DI588_03215 [Flavobacterium johnsoniae]
MPEISDLSKRSNINTKRTYNSEVVIYEDHRTILNVLYFLKTNGLADFPIDLFMFDDHDDFLNPSESALQRIAEFNDNAPTEREFWSFTEFDLKTLDDDWVKAGMELGLINNVFLFHSSQASYSFSDSYATQNFGEKRVYNLGGVWDALTFHGCLDDFSNEAEYGQLWEDIGWVKNNGKFEFVRENNFIVDFDLDCFSTYIINKNYAIPEEILIKNFEEYRRSENHYYGTASMFVKKLIEESALTTVCFENNSCGGIRESHKIFETFDYLFFDREIGG